MDEVRGWFACLWSKINFFSSCVCASVWVRLLGAVQCVGGWAEREESAAPHRIQHTPPLASCDINRICILHDMGRLNTTHKNWCVRICCRGFFPKCACSWGALRMRMDIHAIISSLVPLYPLYTLTHPHKCTARARSSKLEKLNIYLLTAELIHSCTNTHFSSSSSWNCARIWKVHNLHIIYIRATNFMYLCTSPICLLNWIHSI